MTVASTRFRRCGAPAPARSHDATLATRHPRTAQLIDGYVPLLNALPLLVLRLASSVDWSAEAPCFESLARELAAFFRLVDVGEAGRHEHEDPLEAPDGQGACSSAWALQHIVLPAIRRGNYEPPSEHLANATVVQVACTEMLYKVFERC